MEISEIDAPSTEPVMGSPRGDDDPADAAECATADQGAIESDAEKVHIDAHSDLFGRQSPEFLKERGNDAYKNGDFIGACELYTSAIMRLEYSNDDVLKSQLYANRAACHIAVEQYDLAVNDTTDAILMNGSYVKAYLRRSVAYEKKGMTQKACADLEKAIQLDPAIEPKYRDRMCKLKKLAEKEFEREKDEMIGKLKDLGNTLLGKVGLSLDNFKVNKDETTGSYNIQFQN